MSAATIILIKQRQRELIERFEAVGATSPQTARSLDDIGVRTGFIFCRMAHAGVFIQTDGVRWYFVPEAWRRYQDRQWSRLVLTAMVILGVAVLGLAILMMMR